MPKRGENIRKRKDGRWEGRYIYGYSNESKAKYVSIYGKTYFEVKKKLTEATEKSLLDKLPENSRSICFSEVLFLWLSNNKIKLRSQTYSKYSDLIENHIIPELGKVKISKIDATIINLFLEKKRAIGRLDGKGGLSVNSIKALTYLIQSSVNFAVTEGLRQAFNGDINRPTSEKKEFEVLNLKEQDELEKHIGIDKTPIAIGILICLNIGLRIGEICGLQWNDIDFEESTIHVQRTIERIKNTNWEQGDPKTFLLIGETKTAMSNRLIPIPSYLIPSLKSLRESSNSKYVINGIMHEFLEPRTYQYKFHKYLEECKIRDVNFHALRHTFATRCIEVGMDIKSLSEILGHSSVNITLNTYVHSSMDLKRNQIELLGSNRGQ